MLTRICALVTGLCLSGCASVSTMGLARTLNKGEVQGWVAPSGGGVVALGSTAGGTPGGSGLGIGYPLVEGGVRVGVTDHFELGGKLGFSGIGIEGKGALVRSDTMESGVNLSLNPGVTFVGIGGVGAFAGTLTFHLPVLIGIDFAGHELIIGPRLIDQLILGGVGTTSGGANILYAGGSLGIALKLLPGFRMLPEVAFGVPFFATGATGASSTSQLGVGGFIFQAGLGFLFGSADQYERAEPLPMSPPPPPPPPPPAPLPPNAL